jgi:hypothetical protein
MIRTANNYFIKIMHEEMVQQQKGCDRNRLT